MRGAFRMGLRNLRRNRRRTLATGLSIALGIAGLLFVFGYIVRVERYMRVTQTFALHSGHLSVYKRGGLEKFIVDPSTYGFTVEEQAKVRAHLERDGNLARLVPVLTSNGLASNGCKNAPYRAVGIDPEDERWLRSRPEVLEHTPELARLIRGRGPWEFPELEGPVTVSTGLAKLLWKSRTLDEVPEAEREALVIPDCEAPDIEAAAGKDASLQLVAGTYNGTLGALEADMVGIFNPGFTEYEDTGLMLPLATLQRLHETDAVTFFAVFLEEAGGIGTRARALEAELEALGLNVSVYAWDDPRTSPQYTSVRGMLFVIGTFMFGIMALVVTLSIANAMTITVIERRREFGTLRSLGFTPRQVLRLLVAEALALIVTFGTAGLIFGFAAAAAINAANIRFAPPGISGTMQLVFTPNLEMCVLIVSGVALFSAAATWIAARRTLKQGIVELLHAAG